VPPNNGLMHHWLILYLNKQGMKLILPRSNYIHYINITIFYTYVYVRVYAAKDSSRPDACMLGLPVVKDQ